MRWLLVLTLFLSPFAYVNAQYCMGGGPSSTADSNVESVQISGASGTSINYTGCPGVVGVQNLLSYSVTLNASSSYSLFIKFGTCGGNYAGAGQAWIDFNQNGVFDPTESVATWNGTPPAPMNMYNFTVPANAVNGTTRMRIIQQEGTNLPLNPCAPFTWGSVMDFSVVIQGSVNCAGYFGDIKADAIEAPGLPYSDTNSTYICYSNNHFVYPSPDVYYQAIVNPGLSHVRISLCGSNFDTYMTVYTPSDSLVAHNDDGLTCAPESELLIPVAGLDTLLIVVEGWGMDTGTFVINISQENYVATDPSKLVDVKVLPNPTTGKLRIDGVKPEEIVVRSLEGKEMLRLLDVEELDLTGMPLGVYFVGIRSEDRWVFEKVILK